MVSVVGQQAGKTLVSHTTSNARSIALLELGTVPVQTMFAHAHAENALMTWFFRFLGLILMYAGFSMLFEFVVTLLKVIPPLANVVEAGTSIVALALTFVVGLGTIAIAWIVVRPVIGIPLLLVALGVGAYLLWNKRNKKTDSQE